MSDRIRFASLYALFAAAASLVLAPLLALAYFATPEGAGELESTTVSAWAEPARDAAAGLLTFASPDRVYATYLQVLALLFPAIAVWAWLARSRRPQQVTRPERGGWRLSLTGYILLVSGLLALAVVLVAASPTSTAANGFFFALVVPGTLLSTIGSTTLGVALLRAGYRPRLTAWLLALALPFWLAGSIVLGHNSIGLVPLLVAWAATGRGFAAQPTAAEARAVWS